MILLFYFGVKVLALDVLGITLLAICYVLLTNTFLKLILLLLIFRKVWIMFGKRLCKARGHKWVDKGKLVKCRRCKKKQRLVTRVAPERKEHLER